jgi:hypothetical protein
VTVKAPAGGSLELANAMRRGVYEVAPFSLWQKANEESHGVEAARREHFRHALIHAGHVRTAKGDQYKRCPVCRGTLSR